MFDMDKKGLIYQYSPDPGYKLLLDVRTAFEIVDCALLQIERTIKFAHFQSSDRPQN